MTVRPISIREDVEANLLSSGIAEREVLKSYRIAIAIAGTFVAAAAAAASAAYLAVLVLPFLIVVGYSALWLIQRSRSLRVPIGVGVAGILGLIALTVLYAGNRGNWNQPGTQWLLFPLLTGIVLLGANAFAIYARYVASNLASVVGGPALVAGAGMTFWWLLQVDAGRADLYMYRLSGVLACVYGLLGTILIADRRWSARP